MLKAPLFVLLFLLAPAAHPAPAVTATPAGLAQAPRVAFGLASLPAGDAPLRLTLATDDALGGQAFRLRRDPADAHAWRVTGGDDAGLMYGLLELAEARRLRRDPLPDGAPFIRQRGLKMNIPLDGRSPSYDDSGTSAVENIAQVWDRGFWREHLDQMARNRFNVLTLWHNHPFTSMVRLDGYPNAALEDVWVPTYPMNSHELIQYRVDERAKDPANFKVVRRMTIREKIEHWRWVMRYAKERNIAVYFITWNLWTHGATGKYGITNDQTNPKTNAYLRESVKQFVLTYPDLAGMGITLGEHLQNKLEGQDAPEHWGWRTYGLGITDAMADPAFGAQDPDRVFRFIHRVWYGGLDRMFEAFTRKYPGPVDLSFKYARARLYSTPRPPFFENQLRQQARAEGLKTWMNLRNDDLFTLRWGDPDYVRAYLQNLPPDAELAGIHMGSDGYVWGRAFSSKRPHRPRQLETHKHWYRFASWGRLAYHPGLGRDYFEARLAERFGLGTDAAQHPASPPGLDAARLYDAWQTASQIVPLVNLAHWRDWDHMWSVETCMSKKDGYHSVDAFIEFGPLWGQNMHGIDAHVRGEKDAGRSPLDIADALDALAAAATAGLPTPDPAAAEPRLGGRADELQRTLADLRAFAHLGRYYADKLRGATEVHRHRVHGDPAAKAAAVAHLEAALEHWDAYAANLDARHHVQLLARVSHTDWTGRLRDLAAADIAIAKNAQAGVFPPSVVHSSLGKDGS